MNAANMATNAANIAAMDAIKDAARDAAMDATDFQRAGLDGMEIDVALIPFWYFQPGPGVDVIRRYMDAPAKLAVHIPPGEMEEVKDHLFFYSIESLLSLLLFDYLG